MQTRRDSLLFDRHVIESEHRRAPAWPLASLPEWWRTFLFRLLTGRQLSIYLYLLWCMTDSMCYPSASEISSYVGLSGPTMVFDALQALEQYGLIVRERRVIAHLGARRNLYRMPAPQFTIRRLLEHGFLDHELRVKGLEDQYDAVARDELQKELRLILDDRFHEFEVGDNGRKLAMLIEALTETEAQQSA